MRRSQSCRDPSGGKTFSQEDFQQGSKREVFGEHKEGWCGRVTGSEGRVLGDEVGEVDKDENL